MSESTSSVCKNHGKRDFVANILNSKLKLVFGSILQMNTESNTLNQMNTEPCPRGLPVAVAPTPSPRRRSSCLEPPPPRPRPRAHRPRSPAPPASRLRPPPQPLVRFGRLMRGTLTHLEAMKASRRTSSVPCRPPIRTLVLHHDSPSSLNPSLVL